MTYTNIVLSSRGRTVYVEIVSCRGVTGNYRFSLLDCQTVVPAVESALCDSGLVNMVAQNHPPAAGHGPRLTAAIAACPNSCSMPQIKDVGLIAQMCPREVYQDCVNCGLCFDACRENALYQAEQGTGIRPSRCIGCALCVKACRYDALLPSAPELRLLLGGRMGRHPRFAAYVCTIDPKSARQALTATLKKLIRSGRSAWRVSEIMENIELGDLQG